MQRPIDVDPSTGTSVALPAQRHLAECSEAIGFMLHWRPGTRAVLENLPYGTIRHRVVVAEDGSLLYDFPHFVEPGGAALLPIAPGGEVGLVHIDRPALLRDSPVGQYPDFDLAQDFGRLVWEAPRGYREGIEQVSATAFREVCEETGLKLKSLEHVGSVATNSAMMATPIELFLGSVDGVEGSGDHREGVRELKFFNLKQVQELIRAGDLICSITFSLLVHAILLRRIV